MRDRALGSTIRMQFVSTNPDGGGAPVAPSSAFAAADIRIYKDGSAAEKTTTNGITVTSPFDSITGLHLVEIDTSNSTGDSGFWASGSVYHVRLVTAKTVATYSVSGLLIGEFSLELQTADIRKAGGTAITQSSGRMEVNTTHVAGTLQTAGDIAALLSTLSSYVDTEVAAIKAKTDNLPTDPADASDIASAFATVNATLSIIAAYIDTEVAAIKAKTDNLPSDPADASDIAASFSSLASTLSTISGYIDTEVSAIKAKTDQLTFTTANKVDSTAVLDPAARVKLASDQPDYVPATAAALATAYAVIQLTDTDVSAIEARLPSDPADQSAVEAAITAATSPLATSSALSTAAGNITTILGKFTGITLLARWLGALAGKTADTTTRAEINATTAGAGYNETTDSQEAIRDRGDAAWVTGSGGGGGGPAYSAAVIAARLPVGSSAGWPQEIICGSAYLTAIGTHLPFYVKDVDDNILAEMGEKTFTDEDFKAILRLSPLTDENKALAQPAATIQVDSDDSPGIVFNDTDPGEEYFEIQIPKAKTALGEIRTRYLCQLILRWGDGSTYEWYVNLGESKFIRGVAAAP